MISKTYLKFISKYVSGVVQRAGPNVEAGRSLKKPLIHMVKACFSTKRDVAATWPVSRIPYRVAFSVRRSENSGQMGNYLQSVASK